MLSKCLMAASTTWNNDLPRVCNNITYCPSCGQRITVNRNLLDEESANARDRDI
jgi:hypothetical protein